MAGLMKSSIVAFTVIMMVASTTMAQTRHVVGGPLGWTIPSNGPAAYTGWASQQTYTVGDTLFFNFTTGMHNVAEVAQAAYGPCTTSNPISLTTTGPATITLSAPGNHYYICTVGTHCQIGQKLSVNVVAATTAPTPPPAATPTVSPPAATPTPTPTPTVSPPTATPSPAQMSSPTPAPTPAPTPSAAAAAPTPATTPAPSPVGASPPSPTTTTSPSPSGSTTLPPASDTTPTPPSPSGAARSFAAVVPATFLAVSLALFF